ncbi:paraquat-inducible protein A domain containing protein [Nitzschia inconspicua]|uniref:Paraquat-inducible protein A domain containing protein n=1 Tax=Nitzschia inconspicua TaxID=303405 RepID=A0A9K3PWZ2_9STRA|nr:paraquat-inducible protein A domain containing protein [Nitzschia inconspicua]
MKNYWTAALVPSLAGFFAPQVTSKPDLAIGDFDLLNEIFENASIILPNEYEVSQKVGIATLNMNIRNLTCYDLSVGDITVTHDDVSSTVHEVDIAMYGLDLTCEMNYNYKYGILSGDGWVQIRTNGNSASSIIKFTSLDFDQASPVESTIEDCFSDVRIERMDFEGDFVSEILEIFQGLIRNVVEGAIGDVACSELSQIGTILVENIVQLADINLEPYLDDLGESYNNPLYPEQNLNLPADFAALNLQDAGGAVSRAFNEILRFVGTSLGASVSNPDGATTAGGDLAINVMLRSLVLDEDRAFTVNASTLSMLEPPLFEGHDRITQFTVALNRIRVFGLDSFTRFNSFRNIGQHTIQNEFTWNSLTIELDLTVDIKPSTLDDAILHNPTSPGVTERISMGFTVDQVDAESSFLLVMDQETLAVLELGSLFYTENFLPCLLSVVHTIEVTGLAIKPTFVNEPYFSGFVSPGLNRVLTDAAGAAFSMYSGVLRHVIPNIFQSSIRDLINLHFLDAYSSKSQNSDCPKVDTVGGYIDFRTFFDAKKMTHGDVPPLLKEALDTTMLDVNPNTGRPQINEMVVAPFTKIQSGDVGTLQFPVDVMKLAMSKAVSQFGLQSLEFKIFDPTVENLDTVSTPVKLLEPNSTNAYQLDSHAILGADNKKLQLGLKALLQTKGDPLLDMSNQLNILLELVESEVWVELIAKIDSGALFNFPLRDITNINCWLSILAIPESITDDINTGFAIQSLLFDATSMRLNVSCTECSSQSLLIIPEILGLLKADGISDVLEEGLVKLGQDLVQSNSTQSYINSVLLNSRMYCPHNPAYDASEASSSLSNLHMPFLSYESMETIAFALFLALQMGIVVTAETHTNYNSNSTTSLFSQNLLIPADNGRLFDFTSVESSFGQWGLSGINGVVKYLNDIVPDPLGSNGNDMRVNSLLRSSILGERGYASLFFDDLHLGSAGMEIFFKGINIMGLDSISYMDILNVLAPQTMKNEITWKRLQLELVFTLMGSESSTRNIAHGKQAKQDLRINLQLSNVHLYMSMFLALDQQLLGSLQLQSMLKLQNILPCLMSAAKGASLTELELRPESITILSIEGFHSKDVQGAADRSTKLILEEYGAKIVQSVPKIFNSTIRTLINNWMEYHMTSKNSCASFASDSNHGSVDLRDLLRTVTIAQGLGGSGLSPYGDLFRTLVGFIQNVFKTDESTGVSALNNAVVVPLTETLSNEPGTLYQQSDLFNGGTKVKVGTLDANVRFRAFDAKIENLNTIGDPLDLLGGVIGEPYELNNTITFGVNQEPLKFSTKLLLDFDGADDFKIRNEMSFSLELFDAHVLFSTMAKIAESRFFGFPLRDMFNLNCWLATIPAPPLNSNGIKIRGSPTTAGITSLEATIDQLMITAQCLNCSSPRMSEITDLLSDPAAQNETTEVANSLLGYITEMLGGNFIQVQLDRLLVNAAYNCPHHPDYDPEATPVQYEAFEAPDTNYASSYLALLGGLTIAGLVILSSVVFGIRFIVHRRHKKWVTRLPPHQIKRLAMQQKQDAFEEDLLNSRTMSMFKSRDIPLFARYGIPAIILLNIGLFLSGHLSLGATVNIEVQVAGESFTLQNLFEFSIARSTVDIWNAGGRALAILIFLFSGVWPYTKLIMTFVLWFMPPTSVRVNRRGSILLWLDWLAKWSMIDIFVLVISIAAFQVSIASPDTSYLPEDFYSVEMMVIPLWGLYANMLAQLVSQISSHVIIHYHRKICTNATGIASADNNISVSSRPIPNHSQGIQIFRANMEKGQDNFGEIPVARSQSITVIETVQSRSLCTHQFSRPHRVEFGQDFQEATRYQSIFSVVRLLFEQASYLGTAQAYIGLGILSLLFLCTLLLVPITQTVMLLKQWFAASTPIQKERMAFKLEVVQAWQYLDVYLVALFVSSWQMGPVSNVMINSYCDNLKNMFAQMVYYGVLKEEDAQCFSVTSRIEQGAFILASGALLLGFLSSFVFKATVQYLKDYKEEDMATKDLVRCDTSVEDTSHSDDEGEIADGGFFGIIHPAPVLFTDSFRWMLKTDDTLPPSSRALFCDPNNSHWSLPEARAVSDESPREGMIKGTYVRDLDGYNSKSSSRSPSIENSMKSLSKDMYQSKPLPRKLTYDDSRNEIVSYSRRSSSNGQNHQSLHARDMDQHSIPSKMSSVGSSFKDEESIISEADSLNYSLPSSAYQSSQVPLPPELERKASLGSAAGSSMKKPPPPSFYRLVSSPHVTSSATSTASPFASYFHQQGGNEVVEDQKPKAKQTPKTKNAKKPPPSSFDPNTTTTSIVKRAPQHMSEESDDEFTQVSMDDSDFTSDYFNTQPSSQHGRSGLI